MILVKSGGQEPSGAAIHVIYRSVERGIVGAYGIEDLTNIRVHIRGCMSKILVKELVIQSCVMTNLLLK